MNLKKTTLTFIACSLFILTANAQSEEPAKLITNKINDQLYVILGGNGQGAHSGVVLGEDGVVLIDSMVEASNEKLLKAIREISDKPIKYVINTHDHFDHSGGNTFFANKGATIISQESADYDQLLPMFTFAERFSLSGKQEKIIAFHVESHSPTDTIIYLPDSNVIFMGDTFANEWYPALFHGGIKGQNAALDLALTMIYDDTVIVPGHGHITNKAGILQYKDNTNAWVKRIMKLHDNGLSIDKILIDSEIKAIQLKFNTTNKDHSRFDEFYQLLVENTIKAETRLRESP